jgi:hypothetical protein
MIVVEPVNDMQDLFTFLQRMHSVVVATKTTVKTA